MKRLLLSICLAAPALAPNTAMAQGYDDLDSPDEARKKKQTETRSKKEEVVREIVKGAYAKSNVGGAMYLGIFNGYVNPGTSLALAMGRDFIDRERSSAAWELSLFQGVHNGMHYESQAQQGCIQAGGAAPCVQGDLRTYTVLATVEWSTYPNRRVGLGLRAGGGVLYSPRLMNDDYYFDEVLDTWGIADPGFHNTPHPIVAGGPTFEYYTKLSHFSIGADVDVYYVIGFDLALAPSGYLKYTF
ncbi:MAG: adventurous gliding motility protein CglE [Myxococcota bacterium]|nr:adventurous gliding motility protein CglE [Myxococcota bacterium]